jgi:hypothetical protein
MAPLPDKKKAKDADGTDDWSLWNDLDEDEGSPRVFVLEATSLLPPQLHPAVSLGMRRMSYFPIDASDAIKHNSSVADLLSLLEETEPTAPADLLYHDILMNVFGYLDVKDLSAFSETARRPNFECFYFLQLQLQRASLLGCCEDDTVIAGVGALTRLSLLDRHLAEDVVQDFLRSNSTLCTMPLSHSLAYMRQWLRRHPVRDKTAAALFVTILGGTAASLIANDISFGAAELPNMISFGTTELPNMLFRVGFVGSLMGAARTMTSSPQKTMTMRAEALAQTMQEYSHQVFQQVHDAPSLLHMMQAAYSVVASGQHTISEDNDCVSQPQTTTTTLSSPYEHTVDTKKMPSGCVGAYSRAVARASHAVTDILKERRRSNFLALSSDAQLHLSTRFMDACCSDDNFDIVKDIVLKTECIDVEGFYVGSDGTETCALHASAFHGAVRILEFLCHGIDEHDPSHDGGFANVNTQDSNGWTALHFAVGANSVQAVRVLLSQGGACMDLEAVNGYTPLQWAIRLKNDAVAEELSKWKVSTNPARKPLSVLASRFFALIPSH